MAGKVGHIKLYADWKNLSTKAIRIEIDSVLAIIRPVEKFEASNKSEFKRGLLAADEMKWKAAGSGAVDAKDEKAQSLFVQKIIDNIQITLSNVHIRYEDGISAQTSAVPDPARCFALDRRRAMNSPWEGAPSTAGRRGGGRSTGGPPPRKKAAAGRE